MEEFINEIKIMSSFKHDNILGLIGATLPEYRDASMPWMVFEYMKYGDMANVLRNQGKVIEPDYVIPEFNTRELIWLSEQICRGMTYLSLRHFVHRDLACRNCLVTDGWRVKISDFGLSRDVYTSDYYKVGGSKLLPIRWMSPESILYGKFTTQSDTWAFGVVLWEIFSKGKQPFYGHSNEEVINLILQGVLLKPPSDCPLGIMELMKLCWKTEPENRTGFAYIQEKLNDLLCTWANSCSIVNYSFVYTCDPSSQLYENVTSVPSVHNNTYSLYVPKESV